MHESKTKIIKIESVPLAELAKQPVGSVGLYELDFEGDKGPQVKTLFSRQVKARFAVNKTRCKITSCILVEHCQTGNPPAKLLMRVEVK